jgi:hypothetical protein
MIRGEEMKRKKISPALILLIFMMVLLFPSLSPAQISFLYHLIDGNFPGANSVYALDVDGDSLIDVLGSGPGANSITMWKNNGGNPVLWQEQTISDNFPAASSVFSIDLDGDSLNDILGSAWIGNEIAWWRNDGGNPITWTKQTIDQNFAGAEEVYAYDIDNDNDIDVLGASMNGNQIAVWYNSGEVPPVWSKQIIDGNFSWARSVYACCVNGDSLPDILGASYTGNSITVYYNNGDSTWTRQVVDSIFQGAHKVFACDLDNDNDADIIGAAHIGDEIAWWSNEGGNPIVWTKHIIQENYDGSISVYACDIDHDDDLDVLGTTEVSGNLALWLNNGEPEISWQREILSNNFAGAWGVYAEDIDSDGDIDVLGAASVAGDISWWENVGILGVENEVEHSNSFYLLQNFPNPFNSCTKIKFTIPSDVKRETSNVILKVYDVMGNEITTLVNEEKRAGSYEIEFTAGQNSRREIASGVYFYQLKTEDLIVTKKMILLR